MVDFLKSSSSLYERLGGRLTIHLTMEKFCDRLYGDPKLNELTEKADSDELKQTLATEAIELLQNSPAYMENVPQKARALPPMTQSHFDRCISHLIAALVWASVSRTLIEEVLEVVTPLSDYFVDSSPNVN